MSYTKEVLSIFLQKVRVGLNVKPCIYRGEFSLNSSTNVTNNVNATSRTEFEMSQGRASRCSSKIAEGFGVVIKQVFVIDQQAMFLERKPALMNSENPAKVPLDTRDIRL